MAIQKRKIIRIDESKCTGCGECVPSCREGALQIIDGKARLISDVYCDGLGECLGHCPTGALTIEERTAEGFSEEAVNRLRQKEEAAKPLPCGCPGTMTRTIHRSESGVVNSGQRSELAQWPIQLHLIPVKAPYLKNADMVILADCAAVAYANLHRDILKGKVIAMACPKLDDTSMYADKIAQMMAENAFRSVEVVIMEVPCCGGLSSIVDEAVKMSGTKVNVKRTTITIEGDKVN